MGNKAEAQRNCLNTALHLLTKRDHGIEELKNKLRQKGFSRSTITSTIEECICLNYVNDEKFSAIIVRHHRERGYGPQYIRQKLFAVGIGEHLITRVFAEHYDSARQLHACRQALKKKLNRLNYQADRSKIKARLFRFLYTRGFFSETISRAISAELDE